MYQKFDILGINTSLTDKKVYIECTLDVEEATATRDAITLTERTTSRVIDYDIAVNGTIIELTLKDWPVPNLEHLLVVQTGVKSVTDEPLEAALKRLIIFPSEVTSTAIITSPSNYEEINALSLTWIEKQADANMGLVNSYYVEVATENAFYNVVRATTVYGKNDIGLTGIPDGQYFVRVRVQDGDQYGRWSKTITFLFKTTAGGTAPPVSGTDNDDPIYDDDLVILTLPTNGETPSTFLIEFEDILDPDGIEIVLLRRVM
jgi:hypothetical protein